MPSFNIVTTDRENATREQLMRAMQKVSGDSHMHRSMRWHRLLTQITGGIIQSYGAGRFRIGQLTAWRADLALVLKEMGYEQEKYQAEQADVGAQNSAANGSGVHAKDKRPQHRQRAQGAKPAAAAKGRAAKAPAKRVVGKGAKRAGAKRQRSVR